MSAQGHEKTHLLGEDRLDDSGVRVGHGIDVGDDRDAGLGDGHSGENLLKLGDSRLHEVSVESSSDSERDSHASLEVGLGDLIDLGASRLSTGNSVVARAKVVGDLDLASRELAGLDAKSLHGGDVQANDANHAALLGLRGSLHSLATHLDDLKAVLEANGSSEAKSGVLAKAQT